MNTVHMISWSQSVWFADVDDTLINTADMTAQASVGIQEVFEAKYGKPTALIVKNNFNDIFQLMLTGIRNKDDAAWSKSNYTKDQFQDLWKAAEDCQKEIKKEYGAIKKFSREVFIKIAAEKAGLSVSPEMLYEAADAYWITLSEIVEVYPGAVALIKTIKKHKRPFYLLTSSDARLKLKENGQFEYDPSYSENFKRERMALLRKKGIEYNLVSIGDPEDKPHADFFQKGIKMAEKELGHSIDLTNAIMIGDAFLADLQTPKEQLHFGLVILYEQTSIGTKIVDKHQINTDNLSSVRQYLE